GTAARRRTAAIWVPTRRQIPTARPTPTPRKARPLRRTPTRPRAPRPPRAATARRTRIRRRTPAPGHGLTEASMAPRLTQAATARRAEVGGLARRTPVPTPRAARTPRRVRTTRQIPPTAGWVRAPSPARSGRATRWAEPAGRAGATPCAGAIPTVAMARFRAVIPAWHRVPPARAALSPDVTPSPDEAPSLDAIRSPAATRSLPPTPP